MLAFLASGVLHAQQSGAVTYVYTDPQGTPLAEADANGNITATYDYTPYGTTALGTPPKGPGYTGHVNDPETNLVYMQHRYYDPVTGHFLSVDPIATVPGNAFSFNRYDYVNNNPINHTDPDGRCADGVTCDQMVQSYGKWAAANPAEADKIGRDVGVPGVTAMLIASGAGEVVAVVRTAITINKALQDSSSSAPKLTDGQAKNLARFEKKFSANNRNVQVSNGKDGTIIMKNEVPGKVPGSKAVYEKSVDSSGKTTSATKTTYDPKGEVVHVKDKLSQ
ncbi:RHS repeat-associated core domain-containing protein [Dyella nitratireducens]|nr:RHS repeat-associated core domain-containing protein [Dyella nitratireducens]